MSNYRLGLLTLTTFMLLACDDEPDTGARKPLDEKSPAYAVVSTDWSATAISLLNRSGEVVADNYLNSGSTETGLVTALSGDVELPTASGEDGVMVIIDRFKTDVITRVRLSDGEILGQVKTHTPDETDSDSAFTSNPHDYVRISEDTAWVTRNQPNLDPDAAEIDRGDDLLRIDPSAMERSDERIDLSALRGKGTRINPDTDEEEEVDLYARPSRLVRIADTLLVGLGNSAYDFSALGPGTIAVVTLSSREVAKLEIAGLQSCTSVRPVPGASDRALVGCGGNYNEPGTSEGVAIVRVSGGKASVEKTWKLADHADGPALSGSFTALDSDTVTAAANSYAPGGSDSVFGILHLDSGEFEELASIAAGEGTFGSPLYDPDTQKLYVPDASTDSDMNPTAGVRVFERTADGFDEGALIEVAEDTGMPARQVFSL